jgi:hypothetical protein
MSAAISAVATTADFNWRTNYGTPWPCHSNTLFEFTPFQLKKGCPDFYFHQLVLPARKSRVPIK